MATASGVGRTSLFFLGILAISVSLVGGVNASNDPIVGTITTRQVAEAGSGIARGEAEAELSEPIEVVLPILQDYAHYAQFMPNFRRSRVLAQRGGRARVYMEVSAAKGALTLWGQLDLRERVESDSDRRVIEAQLLEGNIDAFRAVWQLEPTADGDGTLIAFQIFVDPDLPLPSSLISRENERAARKTLEALRARLEEGQP